MSNFLLFRASGKNFLATNSSHPFKVLSYFPATTIKKRIIKLYLTLCIAFRIPFWSIDLVNNVYLSGSLDLNDTLIKYLDISDTSIPLLIMWNRGSNRADRVYIWVFNKDHTLVSFIKIVNNNRISLLKEKKALEFLQNSFFSLSYPQVLKYVELEHQTILQTTAVPIASHCTNPVSELQNSQIIDELAKISETKSLSWRKSKSHHWQSMLRSHLDPLLSAQLDLTFKDLVFSTTLVHGDLGSENAYACNGQLWLIDWESSTGNGPLLTDTIAYWLGTNWRHSKNIKQSLINKFCLNFTKSKDYNNIDIFMAILFLFAYRFPPAEIIFLSWVNEEFSSIGIFK